MKETVFRIVSEVLGVPREEVTERLSPDDVHSWDSLQHMNLIFALEEELGIRFSDTEITEMLDVGRILDKAGRHLGSAPG